MIIGENCFFYYLIQEFERKNCHKIKTTKEPFFNKHFFRLFLQTRSFQTSFFIKTIQKVQCVQNFRGAMFYINNDKKLMFFK